MNKNDIIRMVMNDTGLKYADAKRSVTATFGALRTSMLDLKSVNIPSFGTFYLKPRAQRQVHNPHTHSPMTIPKGMTIKFEPSAGFRDEVREIYDKIVLEEELISQV